MIAAVFCFPLGRRDLLWLTCGFNLRETHETTGYEQSIRGFVYFER